MSDSDLASFYADMGINRTGTFTRYGVAQPSPTLTDKFEATLDAEAATGLAPSAPVILYLSQSAQPGDMTGDINTVVQQNAVAVLSISYMFCENQGFASYYEAASGVDSAAAQAAAQGITVIAASGDAGAHPSGNAWVNCSSVFAPAASSYVLAVGGTSPNAPNNNTGAAGSNGYQAGYEYAWGQPAKDSSWSPPCSLTFCGTSGGASTHFQTSEQLGACGTSGTTWRCLPDISLAADFYHKGATVFQGSLQAGAGGTSFAAPEFAAIQAEIDQRQSARKGNVVARLYQIWASYGYAPISSGQKAVFRDMTSGNTGYGTGVGWDAASGLGSVNGWALSSVE